MRAATSFFLIVALCGATFGSALAEIQQPEPFSDFGEICLGPAGDFIASVVRAKAKGFVSDPDEATQANAERFIRDEGSEGRTLSISRSERPGRDPIPDAGEVVCAMSVSNPEIVAVDKAAKGWANVPGYPSSGYTLYVFTLTNTGVHQDLSKASGPQIADALRNAGLWILLVKTEGSPRISFTFAKALK